MTRSEFFFRSAISPGEPAPSLVARLGEWPSATVAAPLHPVLHFRINACHRAPGRALVVQRHRRDCGRQRASTPARCGCDRARNRDRAAGESPACGHCIEKRRRGRALAGGASVSAGIAVIHEVAVDRRISQYANAGAIGIARDRDRRRRVGRHARERQSVRDEGGDRVADAHIHIVALVIVGDADGGWPERDQAGKRVGARAEDESLSGIFLVAIRDRRLEVERPEIRGGINVFHGRHDLSARQPTILVSGMSGVPAGRRFVAAARASHRQSE